MNKIYADVNEDENVDEPNFQWAVLASEAEGHQELLKRELEIAAEQICDYEDKLSSLNESLGIWKVKACEAAEREAALREELRNMISLALTCVTRVDSLRERLTDAEQALKFYADGDHLLLADADAWDTCSGEPINFLHDEAGTASVEDGSIAKAALEG